jgi:predicted RNase H-like HicB family nuclease
MWDSVMAECHRYPLRVQQSKLDGWWFIFVDEVPGLGVLGPNYEDLLDRLKVVAGNVFRARGETVTDIKIIPSEKPALQVLHWTLGLTSDGAEHQPPCKASGALPLHKAQHYRVRDFQGIHYKFGPVHPRFFIEPGTLNHFTPFRRFEKFGYSHLSAASFQANGIADFERHVPFPQSQHGTRDLRLVCPGPVAN